MYQTTVELPLDFYNFLRNFLNKTTNQLQ